ncbi:hypothetical protein DUNSADRAFT_13423 [Dunaliella salina]|uniref:Encoded protein n=1 Tax=Dunaliella salina TaxID=3046 RepID=A0ABQ7H3G5_DUNSA|nr:hypothetical protein DUNSADRAFT_13423 [Dunaliella salina]|eukprot:KAF5841348.1 hypothetical protein DUNSADRAFT_13423 [Dunaliella salina]
MRAPPLNTPTTSEGQPHMGAHEGGPPSASHHQHQVHQQCEDGEVCGHTLRPGVLLQPGQPTTTTLSLRAPPVITLACSSPGIPSTSADTNKGGVSGEAMSEVPLSVPQDDTQSTLLAHVPHHKPGPQELPHLQRGPIPMLTPSMSPYQDGVHSQQGAIPSLTPSYLPYQGAGVLPLPHAPPCGPADSCWGAPTTGTFGIVASPAAPGVPAEPGVAVPGEAAPGVAAPGVTAPGVATPGEAAPRVTAPATGSFGTVASTRAPTGAHFDAPVRPCPTVSSAHPPMGGPLGHWYGSHNLPLRSLPQHAQQQRQQQQQQLLSSCPSDSSQQVGHEVTHVYVGAAQPSAHPGGATSAPSLASTPVSQFPAGLPVSCVDPTVDVAVVWRVLPRGPALSSVSSGGATAAAAQTDGAHGGMSGAGSSSDSTLLGQQRFGAQDLTASKQQQQQHRERFGILWLRNVLHTSSSPLPFVRTALHVAGKRPGAPHPTPHAPPQHLQQHPQGPLGPALSGGIDQQLKGEGSAGRGGGAPLSGSRSGSVSSSDARGDGSHGGACVVVRHDFQRQPLCMVELQLDVRNSAPPAARLTVQASTQFHCSKVHKGEQGRSRQ